MRCLNQWTLRPVPAVVDILGNGNATATVTVNGQSTYRKNEYFHKALTVGNGVYASVTVSATSGSTVNQSGSVFVPAATETYTPDADGNLTQDGRWDYTWDAENRLIVMKTRSGIAGPVRRLEFEYDCFGRRIRKRVYDALSGGNLLLERKFVYSGWNVLAEMDGSNNPVRSYAWGLDLSGSSQGAGGVGGLLYVKPAGGVAHFCAYDGNGNVMALVDGASGSPSAEYEYSAFGETIRMTGALATANPFRFSTKYCDDETDPYYYGFRYYSPSTGRWTGRDPIGEPGGINLYGFGRNHPTTGVDVLGGWPNRDPLGELGFETLRPGRANLLGDGPNLYAFVQNNPVDRTDSLGLAISSIDGAMEACMKLPTPAMQQECLSDLLDTLGVSKECCVLAAAVQVAKKAAGAMGKCNSSDSCTVLRAKSLTWLSVALARSRLHKKCFSGGDAGHQQALAQVWQVIGDCTKYQVQNGCTGPL